jgi:hypothetical protein
MALTRIGWVDGAGGRCSYGVTVGSCTSSVGGALKLVLVGTGKATGQIEAG